MSERATYYMLINDAGQYGTGRHIGTHPLIEWFDDADEAVRYSTWVKAESWLECDGDARVVRAEVVTTWTQLPYLDAAEAVTS